MLHFSAIFGLTYLLLILSAAANPLVFRVKSVPDPSTNRVNYFTAITVKGKTRSVDADFRMDTGINVITLPKCDLMSSNGFTFVTGSVSNGDLFPGPTVEASGIDAFCDGKASEYLAGLGAKKGGLPYQLTRKTKKKLPFKFAYCLGFQSGQLSLARDNYYVFNDTLIEFSRQISFSRVPLTVARTGFYHLTLTGFGMKSSISKLNETVIGIGLESRYTSLPSAAYNLLREQFVKEAEKKRLTRTKSGFGQLDLCYGMTKAQMRSFPGVTMLFGNNSQWVVSPSNYLVWKSKAKNATCFAFLKSGENLPSTIGTFQQEENYIEYDLEKKTLGLSGNLVDRLKLGCADTWGS